ncbi:putative reverse transcriptase domain-containing protein [Tanacetum coccineum]
MRSTGIKRYIDPISGCKIWRTNLIQRRRIVKEGNVSRFQEYHTSDEEEEELSEHPPYNKYGFVDHPQLQMEDIVANGKKEEVDRIFHGYRLELEDSILTIELIPLGQGSFDVIVGMDWLSNQKAVIVCHEKIVRIPVEEGKVLCVQGELNVGKTKTLMSTKANEPTLSYIPIVCDFKDVFPDDLSGLPPQTTSRVSRRIDKEGNVSRFQGYHTSDEEEEELSRHPPYNKYGFVDHPQLQREDQRNEFAPYLLPLQKGNMNGWLTEDANDSDLESAASNQRINLTIEDTAGS